MWSSIVDGQRLTFRLMGVNNQNFVMEDLETGTWWQQVTGEALLGPLAGKRLQMLRFDEVALSIWQEEHPQTLILEPVPGYEGRYYPEDWDTGMDAAPAVPAEIVPPGEMAARQLVVGIVVDEQAVAYPIERLVAQTPISDRVGAVPVLVAVAADGRSVRAFDRRVDGVELDLYVRAGSDPPRFVDAQTGTEWGFSGRALAGELAGQALTPIAAIKDYWFDWKGHNPETRVYRGGR